MGSEDGRERKGKERGGERQRAMAEGRTEKGRRAVSSDRKRSLTGEV
jgi:hypothetical protein